MPSSQPPSTAQASAEERLSPGRQTFDEPYFERYYERRRTRVYGPEQVTHLARGVFGMIRWLGGNVSTVLDVGAGLGFWRAFLREHEPAVRYRSIDASEYACRRYDHERLDITRWHADERFDLVVCQGVLPYLPDRDVQAAIDNIASMARGFVYVEAITSRDLEQVCDTSKTDVHVFRRPGEFYRAALARHFVPVGLGLFYAKSGDLQFYELET